MNPTVKKRSSYLKALVERRARAAAEEESVLLENLTYRPGQLASTAGEVKLCGDMRPFTRCSRSPVRYALSASNRTRIRRPISRD